MRFICMTDEELIIILEACQNGDKTAFGKIYDGFSSRLFKFIYFRVGHKQTAEDILSDSFVKAFSKINQINSSKSLSGWLFKIAKNNIIDFYRIKKPTFELREAEEILDETINPVDEADLSFDQKLILESVEKLPKDQRRVIQLRFYEDLTNAEIAAIMDKSEGAIRIIVHRAIVRLQEIVRNVTKYESPRDFN
jgi:RNA polymerase sigma-70 factor (ECF subfamily)